MNGATAPLRSGRNVLLERGAAWRQRLARDLARYLDRRRNRPTDLEVARAWVELKEHPALSWVPPIWRGSSTMTEAVESRHVLTAVDKNLLVEISRGPDRRMIVQLRTGPLQDRRVGDGVDPTTPAVSVNPELTVSAPSFEEAVIELRDVVMQVYGKPSRAGHDPVVLSDGGGETMKASVGRRLKSLRR